MNKQMKLGKGFSEDKIIGKNKDYSSVQEARHFYEKKRLQILSETIYPKSEIPTGFKENLLYLMRFQNPVQMNVWHNKQKSIIDKETGNRIATTWENFCTFSRHFVCAEMYQAIEILKRCTPNEVWCGKENFDVRFPELVKMEESSKVLHFFNEIFYPDIEVCVGFIQKVLDEIEEQLCTPIRSKINSDLKVMLQLPVGSDAKFIEGKQRKM